MKEVLEHAYVAFVLTVASVVICTPVFIVARYI